MILKTVSQTRKIKNLQAEEIDPLIYDHVVEGSGRYIIFLADERPTNRVLASIRDDFAVIGIDSYLILSVLGAKIEKDSTDEILTVESKWRRYLEYKGLKCDCIIASGRAVRILNRSADIGYYDFYDEKFNPTRYFCGSRFVGGPDKWIYPVAPTKMIYPFEELPSYKVVTNMHTRFFRYQLKRAWNDDYELPRIERINPIVHIINNEEETSETLRTLMDSEILAVDTETSGFDFNKDELGTIQLCNDGINGYVYKWSLVNKRLLKAVLCSAKRIVLANGKFDQRFIYKNGVTGWKMTDDTCLLAHAINSYRPKGLKPNTWFWSGTLGGYDDELDKIKKKLKVKNYLQIPYNILGQYAGMDPIATWRQLIALEDWCHYVDKEIPNEKIPEWTIWRFYKEIMIPNLEAVTDIELDGVFFSEAQFEESRRLIDEKIKESREKMAKIWNVSPEFRFESTKELGSLFEKMGWDCIERSKSGEYSTSDTVLQEYKRLGMPGIEELKTFRSFMVARNTFITGWGSFTVKHEDGTLRIHPSCNCFGVVSFRHAMNDPNFQQIPSQGQIAPYIKKLFTTPPAEQDYEIICVETPEGKKFNNEEYSNLIVERNGTETSVRFEDLTEQDVALRYDDSTYKEVCYDSSYYRNAYEAFKAGTSKY